ncbi:MAG: hypothetical protein KDD67_02570 [Ignavibacteriae bacterium]|nr:hypothetical protein [Ignavibacteriota bacterium]MCB9216924.1 hypothetical protein [Ignavibacteria bacterium]
MFSKQVWHDRKHQAEVFVNEEGVVSGSILSFKKGICLVNPRPEILIALYQEAKIKRILSINAVVLTDSSPEFVRGLCTLISYSRELRRRKPLTVYVTAEGRRSPMFVNSCCAQLMTQQSLFDLEIVTLPTGKSTQIGEASLKFHSLRNTKAVSNPMLEIATAERTIHFYDETCTEELDMYKDRPDSEPDIIIRSVQLSQFRQILKPETRVVKV